MPSMTSPAHAFGPNVGPSAFTGSLKQNPHVEVYLNGHRKLPRNLPASYSVGSKEEALCYAGPLLMAWTRHPEAQAWLAGRAKMDRMDQMDRMHPME